MQTKYNLLQLDKSPVIDGNTSEVLMSLKEVISEPLSKFSIQTIFQTHFNLVESNQLSNQNRKRKFKIIDTLH